MLAPWTGPFEGVPPWDKMDPELFPDAFAKAMAETKAQVQAVIDNPEAPTFENTHVPMMLAGDTADRLFALWGVQSSNKSNDRVEAIDAEWSPQNLHLLYRAVPRAEALRALQGGVRQA